MYTNNSNIPLPFAIWLASDFGYDRPFDPTELSVTEIIRPIRSIILSRQLAEEKAKAEVITRDIEDKAAAALGTAVHTAVEHGWVYHLSVGMENLGYPQKQIERVAINPKDPNPDDFNVYFEKRTRKQIKGFTLSGKFDVVMDGTVRDIKTTKAYTYMKGSQDEKYRLQGSMYRWLNPELITNDFMFVDYYFTDWSPVAYQKEKEKNYPPTRMLEKRFDLMSPEETQMYVEQRLDLIKQYTGVPQTALPRCTSEELWKPDSEWEYWTKATNKRCSNLLKTRGEAEALMASKGMGFLRERQQGPRFCKFCDASSICKQAQEYIAEGILTL